MDNNVSKKRSQSNEIDMLNGPLLKKILLFALPLAASSLLQELFNSVDVAVVGHFVGSEALAAVGSNAPVIGLLINLFMGVSMGACAVISNHIGQQDDRSIRHAIDTVQLVAVISGFFLLILGQVAARPILILRSMGDTRRPLYILVMAGVVNTLLNLLFVICFRMGVAGVAVATGIANAVSATLIIRLLRKEKEPFRLHFEKLKIHTGELSRMLRIGVPAINSYGADAIAGSSAALNFEYYCYFIIQGFNGAAISFIAQNYGAGKMDRVHRIFWICMGSCVAFCAAFNWLFAWQNDFFLNFFSSVPMVHHYGAIRMHIVLALQFIASSYEIAGSSLRGMGKSLTPAVLTVFGTCLLRIVWVYGVSPVWRGYDILMMVYPVSWVLTGLLVLTAYWLTVHKRGVKVRQ